MQTYPQLLIYIHVLHLLYNFTVGSDTSYITIASSLPATFCTQDQFYIFGHELYSSFLVLVSVFSF